MNLVFIYGPAAVGKLTVAKALESLTGIPLADNHSLLNPLAKVFGWDHPERDRLGRVFRFEFFQAAARANKSLITTLGGGGKIHDDFIQEVRRIVEVEGGRVCFVRLHAPLDVLLARVREASRARHEKMQDEETLKKRLASMPDILEAALVPPHLEIDSSKNTPEAMANMIREYYKL